MTQLTSINSQNSMQTELPVRRLTQGTGWIDSASRKMIDRLLSNLEGGQLTIDFGSEYAKYGQRSHDDLVANMIIHDSKFFRKVLLEGSLGFAESYIQGYWTVDNLTDLIRLFSRNLEALSEMNRGIKKYLNIFTILAHRLRSNTRKQAVKNISEHYDLSNEFFSLFLDETMMYSSAYFSNEQMTLKEASTEKLDRICKKLQLKPDDRLIEIGTGWGGFAEHAVKNYGCHVTTTTISQEQYNFAKSRFESAGISNQVDLLLSDYRDLSGQFDKLVSIEMIEAVGHEHFERYFAKCGELLKPNGDMLIQAITIPEQRFEQYIRSVDFIQKYIFPGGCLPSILSMQQSIADKTNMRILDIEDFASHYSRTLNHWNKNFFEEINSIRQLGFPESFVRKWHYYFCYCEAAFLERATGVVQLIASKPGSRLELSNHI